jgi:glutaredoxin-like YruB-family protein
MVEEKSSKEIIVYSTKTCPFCMMAKRYLTEKGIKFRDVDVGSDQKAAFEMFIKSGQMGVPVLDIDGEIIIGFDKPAIERALSNFSKK